MNKQDKENLRREQDEVLFIRLNKAGRDVAAWSESKGFETGWGNLPEKLMLIVTEVSEAMEAFRDIKLEVVENNPLPYQRDKPVDLVHQPVSEIVNDKLVNELASELGDVIIRVISLAHSLGFDLESAIRTKHKFNLTRPPKHGRQR